MGSIHSAQSQKEPLNLAEVQEIKCIKQPSNSVSELVAHRTSKPKVARVWISSLSTQPILCENSAVQANPRKSPQITTLMRNMKASPQNRRLVNTGRTWTRIILRWESPGNSDY